MSTSLKTMTVGNLMAWEELYNSYVPVSVVNICYITYEFKRKTDKAQRK